jgi:aspartyl protease family protein
VRAEVNGVKRRFLVDTGATLTTLSPGSADAASIRLKRWGQTVVLSTANGRTTGTLATIDSLRVGNVVARHIDAVVAPGLGETNVLGMNFLSRLAGWRVEGKTMILIPHHPAATPSAET